MIKLSIIIPYYKTYDETIKLLNILIPQLTDEVEVFIIDDGCNVRFDTDDIEQQEKSIPITIIHLSENHGLSYARNRGIEKAKGQYIAFIDSDDYVANDYIETIINKINTSEFDYCYFSWQMINKKDIIRIKDNPPSWNLAVWNAVYKREYVEMFDDNIRFCEDVPWHVPAR